MNFYNRLENLFLNRFRAKLRKREMKTSTTWNYMLQLQSQEDEARRS